MTAKEYARLPYSWTVFPVKEEGESYYVAKCNELKGCSTHASDMGQLQLNMIEALESHIGAILASNREVPLPVQVVGV